MFVFFFCVSLWFLVTLGFNDNIQRCGVYQHWQQPLSNHNYVKGWDLEILWKDVETKKDNWDWSSVNQNIKDALDNNPDTNILINALTGNDAPLWIYDQNNGESVPAVYLQTDGNHPDGPWPYYLDSTYQELFQKYITKIFDYIERKNLSNIFCVQAMFGSTGDDTPWHGTPINGSYDISESEWWEYSKNMSLFMYDKYSKSNSFPNLLLMYNFGTNMTKQDWVTDNCPCSYRKAGQVSHGYQLNTEYTDYMTLGALARTVQDNCTLRVRGELSSNSTESGWWLAAPYWNLLSLVEWSLTYGLDFLDFKSNFLDNTSYTSIFELDNMFAGIKDPAYSKGGWIHLRDGLDSNNTDRWPVSIFGDATESNGNRMILIAQNMSLYGANQDDPDSATGGPMNQRRANGLNDVGFGIWDTNYGNYIKQIYPMNTSQGYWRIGSNTTIHDMYGRFGRGFDYKSNKNTMCFQMNTKLWDGLPIKNERKLMVNITYFDNNNDKWGFSYDNKNNSKCGNDIIITENTNTNKWIIKNIDINDAYFGERCQWNSDFCLINMGTHNTIFSFIQIISE